MKKTGLFGLGAIGALIMDVPAGERRTYRFAISFNRGGIVTAGMDASYYYSKFFKNIEEVTSFALARFHEIKEPAVQSNETIDKAALSDDQRFMMAHAIPAATTAQRSCLRRKASRSGSSTKVSTA